MAQSGSDVEGRRPVAIDPMHIVVSDDHGPPEKPYLSAVRMAGQGQYSTARSSDGKELGVV
ncbi:hypothetical protein D3C76_1772630 [compost metagenome]